MQLSSQATNLAAKKGEEIRITSATPSANQWHPITKSFNAFILQHGRKMETIVRDVMHPLTPYLIGMQIVGQLEKVLHVARNRGGEGPNGGAEILKPPSRVANEARNLAEKPELTASAGVSLKLPPR